MSPETASALSKWLRGEHLSPDEAAALNRWIASEPAAARRALDYAFDEIQLKRLFAPAGGADRLEDRRPIAFPWRRAAVAAGLLVSLGGLLLLLLRSGPAPARIASISPGVVIERGGERAAAAAPAEMRGGDVVRVPEGGRAELEWPPGRGTVEARDAAVLRIPAAEGAPLFLEAGALEATVRPRPAASPVSIRTPEAEAVVLGTRFRLRAAPGRTTLSVQEGRVRLTRLADGASVEVAAGERAEVGLGVALRAAPAEETKPPDPSVLWSDGFEDLSPWGRQGNDDRVGDFSASADRPHGGRQCLRFGYRYLGLPATQFLKAWDNNLRYVGRAVEIPREAARLRFRLREETAAPGAKLHVFLMGREFGAKGKESWGWSFALPLARDAAAPADAAGWRRIELSLDAPQGYWNPETKDDDPARHPISPRDVTAVRFAGSDAGFEISLDDLQFVRR